MPFTVLGDQNTPIKWIFSFVIARNQWRKFISPFFCKI